jgi:hypothetical protein
MFARMIDDFKDQTGTALRLTSLAAAVAFALFVTTSFLCETTKSAMQTALADPMLVAAGIQVIRAIGIKKLLPILAVGGLALGFLASRNTTSDEAPAE